MYNYNFMNYKVLSLIITAYILGLINIINTYTVFTTSHANKIFGQNIKLKMYHR